MNPSRGIAYKVISVLIFTCMYVCIKATQPQVPPGQVAFFRSFFALVPIGAYLLWRNEFPGALYTKRPMGHFWRGVFGTSAMVLNFAALGLLPLADAIAIGYGVPMFTAIFAALLLGEVIRAYRWWAIAVGFIGVLIIMWPKLSFLRGQVQTDAEALGAVCAIGATAAIGLALVHIRGLVRTERTPTIVFYFSVSATALSLLTIPFGWRWPDPTTAALLVLAGLLGGIGQIFLTECYRHADMSTLAPFEYTSLLFSIAFGYLLFGEATTAWTLAGSAIVMGAGVFMVWREGSARAGR
ncbi:MAG: hypothetical protein RLZ98_458 [Pseudomonadota bacterium]|jgi:drug/metabolite transporter (DMT)-like permease